jgi:hypothetical protein
VGIFRYSIKLKCENCNAINLFSIKKGITTKEFMDSSTCRCKNCGVKVKNKKFEIVEDGVW